MKVQSKTLPAVGIAMDLRMPKVRKTLRELLNKTVRDTVALAEQAGMPFVVLAGQLFSPKGIAFGALAADEAAFADAVALTVARARETGFASSMWLVQADAAVKANINELLAQFDEEAA